MLCLKEVQAPFTPPKVSDSNAQASSVSSLTKQLSAQSYSSTNSYYNNQHLFYYPCDCSHPAPTLEDKPAGPAEIELERNLASMGDYLMRMIDAACWRQVLLLLPILKNHCNNGKTLTSWLQYDFRHILAEEAPHPGGAVDLACTSLAILQLNCMIS